jgi:deoxycytidylate deaminase
MNHIEMMRLAESIALKSVCKRAQVGAVVSVLSEKYTGYNRNDDKLECCEGADGRTLATVVHAEAMAINAVFGSLEDTVGGTLYVTRQPCIKCAELIVKAGIGSVFYRDADDKDAGLRMLYSEHVTVDSSWITGQVAQDWADRNELIGTAKPAGIARDDGRPPVQVYKDASGEIHYRYSDDFFNSMEHVP